ncbi:MAG TPA: PTS system mannose/fructose/sorbose family transporter subunit IID [Gemmatimonadaceae bacterium]|nr:PTS system mannose/fructose/sorbose family transporter subunit IID [Gemmatimonadaceae bacterium]
MHTGPEIPFRTRVAMFTRLLAIQGSWNYETLLGNGIGFCVEPALRLLPGGEGGPAYRAALARQSQYFNAHPYMAAVAVGALARAELDGESPAKIERFRTALCGPLGSVGDRLVWAGWLPACSIAGLAAFGFGVGTAGVLLTFLGLYNAGHLALRAWGLSAGLDHGMKVASALGEPILRKSPPHIAQVSAFVGGVALPLALDQVIGPGRALFGIVLAAVALGGLVLARLHGRVEGWKVAVGVLALFVLYSVAR